MKASFLTMAAALFFVQVSNASEFRIESLAIDSMNKTKEGYVFNVSEDMKTAKTARFAREVRLPVGYKYDSVTLKTNGLLERVTTDEVIEQEQMNENIYVFLRSLASGIVRINDVKISKFADFVGHEGQLKTVSYEFGMLTQCSGQKESNSNQVNQISCSVIDIKDADLARIAPYIEESAPKK